MYCAHFIILHSDEFGQLPPSQIVPRLADCGQYIASESTFYRVLRAENQLKQRRAERPVKQRHKPRALSATAPNQLVSWDITYLPTLVLGVYFTCICSSIFLAAKSLAGKFMIQKAVNWPATSCAIFACEKNRAGPGGTAFGQRQPDERRNVVGYPASIGCDTIIQPPGGQ